MLLAAAVMNVTERRDIQEDILFLSRVHSGRDPIREHAIRHIAATADWGKQRRMWGGLRRP